MPILVFLDERQTCVAGLTDAGDDSDRCRLFRIQCYPALDSDNRIKHGTLAVRQRRDITHRLRIDERISAANETHPVRFIRYVAQNRLIGDKQVKHP